MGVTMLKTKEAIASNLLAMSSTLVVMASKLPAMPPSQMSSPSLPEGHEFSDPGSLRVLVQIPFSHPCFPGRVTIMHPIPYPYRSYGPELGEPDPDRRVNVSDSY